MSGQIYSICGVILFSLGAYGLLAHAHPLRKVLALNIVSSGVFLVFVASSPSTPASADPVPQAFVLTGIVVAVSATALAVALIRKGFELADGRDQNDLEQR